MTAPYQRLLRHWTGGTPRIEVRPRSEAEVAALETRLDVKAPDDFRAYLLNANPVEHCQNPYDERIDWRSLEQLKTVAMGYHGPISAPQISRAAKTFLIFADYAAWGWCWAIDCGAGETRGEVALLCSDDRIVAHSFADFVDEYVKPAEDERGGS